MQSNFLSLFILLLHLLPLTLTAPTPVLPDSAYAYLDRDLQPRQAPAAATSALAAAPSAPVAPVPVPSPPAASPPSPSSSSSSSSSSTQLVTTIVQAVWPDIDPLIQEAVIYFASGIPTLLGNLMSSWGL